MSRTIRSKLVGSIGGCDESSSLMVAYVIDSPTRLGWKMRRTGTLYMQTLQGGRLMACLDGGGRRGEWRGVE